MRTPPISFFILCSVPSGQPRASGPRARPGLFVAKSGARVAEARGCSGAIRVTPGMDDKTVEAVGAITEALETTERARGHLYSFHQLTGSADLRLGEGVHLLREAGHTELADRIEHDLVGRNVIPDHWTFQIMEEYDDT